MVESAGASAIEVSCGVAEDLLYTARGEANPLEALFAYSHKYRRTGVLTRLGMRAFSPVLAPPAKPRRLYNVEAAELIRSRVSIPVIVVGGIRSRAEIEEIIGRKRADFVSLSRPFILEPGLVRKMRDREQEAARCLDCCYCLIGIEAGPLRCHYGKIHDRIPAEDDQA